MTAYNCPNCEEQDVTPVTCPICDKHFCVECQDENFRCCHVCDKMVCLDCHTYHKVNGIRTCDTCFDDLVTIKSKCDAIMLGINQALKDSLGSIVKEGVSGINTSLGLRKLCGHLEGLKNRFGF